MSSYMYYKPECPFSRRAITLLEFHGIPIDKIDVTNDTEKVYAWDIQQKFGKEVHTVPQIVIDGQYVGGFNDLRKMFSGDKKYHEIGKDETDDNCRVT
jgi:glutaredoxin